MMPPAIPAATPPPPPPACAGLVAATEKTRATMAAPDVQFFIAISLSCSLKI